MKLFAVFLFAILIVNSTAMAQVTTDQECETMCTNRINMRFKCSPLQHSRGCEEATRENEKEFSECKETCKKTAECKKNAWPWTKC